MSENKPVQLTCPFCNRDLSLKIGLSKETFVDKQANVNVQVEDVRQALPQDIVPNLNVALSKHSNPQVIHIVPRKFLGKENFYRVMKSVKAMNGEWVSQGKQSYWWVPATKEVQE